MAEKVEVSQEDIAFVRSLENCPDKPLHESMFVPFFASKIGEYRAAAFEAGREQGLREAAEVARGKAESVREKARRDQKITDGRGGLVLGYEDAAAAITALIEGEEG